MNLISIYEGLADPHRLRIVYLLLSGPLGVKHLQIALGISQVRVSKHLAYLRERRMVEVDRHRNWMIYRLPTSPSPEFAAHLRCLAECVQNEELFQRDVRACDGMRSEVERVKQLVTPAAAGTSSGSRSTEIALAPAIGWNPDGDSGYID